LRATVYRPRRPAATVLHRIVREQLQTFLAVARAGEQDRRRLRPAAERSLREGKVADARSDLWAFGCILYEKATGKRAVYGKSQAGLIGAIMKTPSRRPSPRRHRSRRPASTAW